MKQKMLIVTDGNNEQIMGLRLFVHTIKKNSPSIFRDWDITILYPSYSTLNQSFPLDIASVVTPIPIWQEKHADKYYVKLLLKDFVENHASDEDLILYLDYDHIARSELRLPTLAAGELYVGSEIKPLSSVVDHGAFSETDQKVLADTHYNASLIFATNLTWKMAVRDWADIYETCVGLVAPRYVEEIAFFLSAFRSRCRVIPIPQEIQSGWQHCASSCQIFHYGGEHYFSMVVKQLLTQLSNPSDEIASISLEELGFAIEFFEAVHGLAKSVGRPELMFRRLT